MWLILILKRHVLSKVRNKHLLCVQFFLLCTSRFVQIPHEYIIFLAVSGLQWMVTPVFVSQVFLRAVSG